MGLWICSLVCHRYLRERCAHLFPTCASCKVKQRICAELTHWHYLTQPSDPHHASASGDVQSCSQLLPAQHSLMKSILFPWLHGTDKDKTLWCDWWGRGEEIILMVMQGSWDSKEEKKTLTDLAQWPLLQILFSQFAFLLCCTAQPFPLMFLKGQNDFWRLSEISGTPLKTFQCRNSQWDC